MVSVCTPISTESLGLPPFRLHAGLRISDVRPDMLNPLVPAIGSPDPFPNQLPPFVLVHATAAVKFIAISTTSPVVKPADPEAGKLPLSAQVPVAPTANPFSSRIKVHSKGRGVRPGCARVGDVLIGVGKRQVAAGIPCRVPRGHGSGMAPAL
jgi:hypothetical protein